MQVVSNPSYSTYALMIVCRLTLDIISYYIRESSSIFHEYREIRTRCVTVIYSRGGGPFRGIEQTLTRRAVATAVLSDDATSRRLGLSAISSFQSRTILQ